MARNKWKGIRRRRNQMEVRARIGGGVRVTKYFPLTAPLEDMRAWQAAQRAAPAAVAVVLADSLAGRIQAYLPTITAMPTYRQRVAHLEGWAHALGRDRDPVTVTAAEIDTIMQQWLTTPTRPDFANGQRGRPSHPRGLDPETVRKRRTSLMSFYRWLVGPRGHNPVRESQPPPQRKPEVRAIAYDDVEAALAQMPDDRDTATGQPRRRSKSKIRARVMAYTGIPPGLLKRITPADLNLAAATVRVQARQKGGGVEARTLPLSPAAVAAFQDFHLYQCYGPFATESVNRSFRRACQAAGLHPDRVRLYDLRHSFGTELYRLTKDLATVGRLLLHAPGSRMTGRYAQAANAEVDAAAVAAFGASILQKRRAAIRDSSLGTSRDKSILGDKRGGRT